MNEYEINDIREKKDLKGATFSNYKKSEVKKTLIQQMYKENLEQSLYWSCELICSGAYMDLWEIILLFISKYIHLGNPKIAIYIELRFQHFKSIITGGYIGNELPMRNNEKIRTLFGEIITVLCLSPKRHSFDTIKISKDNDFNLTHLQNRFKAPNTNFADIAFKKDDPKELFISINELSYHLSKQSRNLVDACFWIEWIIEYETICKQQKKILKCERREKIPVDPKFQTDSIWIIWDIIINNIKSIPEDKNKAITKKIIDSLLTLFCLHYSSSCKKKRRYMLYYAVSILIDNYNPNIEIIHDKTVIENVLSQIKNIYKQIKKSEVKPKTDYLFNGVEEAKSNLEKTVEKLDKLNEIIPT